MRVKGNPEAVNVYEVGGLESLRRRLQRAVGGGLTRFVRHWKGASRWLTMSTGVRYPKARRLLCEARWRANSREEGTFRCPLN